MQEVYSLDSCIILHLDHKRCHLLYVTTQEKGRVLEVLPSGTHPAKRLSGNKIVLVNQNPPPVQKKKRRGRKQVNSNTKMHCICIIMVAFGLTYRDTQNIMPSLNLPYEEPAPDHTTIAKHFKKISVNWLELVLTRTAYLCMSESGWSKGILGADNTPVETDLYRYEMRPAKNRREFVQVRIRQYLK